MEIEKKFLLGERPSILSTIIGVPVKQGYLVTEDGELRIRQKGEKYFMTVKGDGTLSREEWEVEIPEWVFSTLWQKTTGKQIEKIRFAIDFQGLVLEVDEYFGNLAGLFTMECEFESVEDAEAFRLPQWAATAVDVTANKAFKNKVLAVKGRPQ